MFNSPAMFIKGGGDHMVRTGIRLLQVLKGGNVAMVHIFVVGCRERTPFLVAIVLESSVDLLKYVN